MVIEGRDLLDNLLTYFFFKKIFLSRDSSALICWSSTYLVGTSGALLCRGVPTVHFICNLPGGCGGV